MRQRSSYPKPFKAQIVQECLQPGASISSVAISHGIVCVRPSHLPSPAKPRHGVHLHLSGHQF
ncbi:MULTISPECIES: transposase [Pseudomonas]|uniref:transposase n=1 Tax=Pseudomonas TaxID=286 RepID=UPI0009ED01AD|nr:MULTISPECIES: transposase [Pseudomonas]TSB48667.1 hypothetical protein FEE99_28920 [Pseudomonas sp. ef1]